MSGTAPWRPSQRRPPLGLGVEGFDLVEDAPKISSILAGTTFGWTAPAPLNPPKRTGHYLALGFSYPLSALKLGETQPLASFADICKAGRWLCTADSGQQLSVGQDHSNTLDGNIQFKRNALVSIPGRIKWARIQTHHFFPTQTRQSQQHSVILTNNIQLQHKVSANWHICNICNVTNPWWNQNLALCWKFRSTISSPAITSATRTLADRNLSIWQSLIQSWNGEFSMRILTTNYSTAITETWIYDIPAYKGGMSHSPWAFSPQATALPSLRRSTAWPAPICGLLLFGRTI